MPPFSAPPPSPGSFNGMKKICTLICCLAIAATAAAQNVGGLLGALLGIVTESAAAVATDTEPLVGLPQQSLATWGIKPANYSGITPLGDGRYAVVSDKGSADGFHVWKIAQDPETGAITSIEDEGFFANRVNTDSGRDCEGIAYFPKSGCVFISGESDGRVIEYDMEGQRTGRELKVPEQFRNAVGNQGLEALGFGGKGGKARFWVTTETSLLSDGVAAGPKNPGGENLLRLQSFRKNLAPAKQFLYTMDSGRNSGFGSTYVFGVPEVCALPDGHVLVLEREANIPSTYVGADVKCKLYSVKPKGAKPLVKELVTEWSTSLSIAGLAWANYEGMCLGAKLSDGRQTLLLVSDSQGGYSKGPFSLKDFIKVIYL